jgi:hypothetical protein
MKSCLTETDQGGTMILTMVVAASLMLLLLSFTMYCLLKR